jgi:hypothetical protein
MGEYLDQVPPEIQGHLRQITKSSGLPDTDDSTEMIAQGWLEKRRAFEKITARMNLEEVDFLEKTDERGCLAMTWSGSLLNVGPIREGGRLAQYTSIGLRKDVPEAAAKAGSQLGADVRVGAPVSFTVGPIASSSPILKIAVTSEDMDLAEQERLITKATEVLTRDFVKTNEDLESEQ